MRQPLPVFGQTVGDLDQLATALGITENPATGGASGPLGTYLVRHGAVSRRAMERMVSLQAVAMRRPSRIHISIRGEQDEG